jgi:hypothetical protein
MEGKGAFSKWTSCDHFVGVTPSENDRLVSIPEPFVKPVHLRRGLLFADQGEAVSFCCDNENAVYCGQSAIVPGYYMVEFE